jgi:aryl-alcohol dehydrogenase-like predicted oxidoreductase
MGRVVPGLTPAFVDPVAAAATARIGREPAAPQEVEMESRQCGRSALRLSALGIGCWSFGGGDYWGACRQEDADAVVRRAVELGISYFDTAEAYNDGRSETALGRALRGVDRDRVLVGSKVSPSHCYAETLPRHCEASLRRLGLDHLDLYMIHWPLHPHSIRHFTAEEAVIANPPTVEEAFAALGALQRQGKIRHIGVSNFGAARLDEALRLCPDLAVNQLPHSLLARAIELEALPRCRQAGVGVIGYMTLLQGVLSDRYPDLGAVPPQQRRTRHFDAAGSPLARHGGAGAEAETAAGLAAIRAVAAECGLTTAEIAAKWALAVPGIACCLVGARSVRRLEENIRAAHEPLPPEIFERLHAATQPLLEKLGDSFDYYESVENDRTR